MCLCASMSENNLNVVLCTGFSLCYKLVVYLMSRLRKKTKNPYVVLKIGVEKAYI